MYASIAFVAMLLPRKASVTLSGTKENHDHYTLHVHMPGRVTCKTVIVIKSMIHIGLFSEINREVFHEGWELKKAKVRGSPDPPSGHTCPMNVTKKTCDDGNCAWHNRKGRSREDRKKTGANQKSPVFKPNGIDNLTANMWHAFCVNYYTIST